jgi:hypothetical protein
MQLNVTLHRDGEKVMLSREAVVGFDDAEYIGTQVGRAVRDWLRERPFRASGTRTRFDVYASWGEANGAKPDWAASDEQVAKAKRRRRKKS